MGTGSLPARFAADSFLSDSGEMAARIRAHAWADTPLGPLVRWPQALRTTLRLMLNARQPMFLFWGPQLICFYNDAYRQTMGSDRHPLALGRPGREVWSEVWATLGAEIERVLSGGPAVWHERQRVPLMREGALVDTWWTFGYSPVDDDTAPNGIGGVLAITTEVTADVEAFEQLKAMFEQAPGFMAVLRGPEHRIVVANAAYRALIGWRDVVGLTVRQALPEVGDQGYFDMLDEVYRTGKPLIGRDAPVELEWPRGSQRQSRWIDFIYQPLFSEDGQPHGIFVQGHDVTEQHQAMQALVVSEQRFRAVQEASAEGFMVLESVRDTDGKVEDFRWVYANAAAARIVGRARDWFLGRCLLKEMPGNREAGLYDAYVKVVETGEPWTTEITYQKEGIDVYLRIIASRAGDGFAVTFADLSERRCAELERERLLEALRQAGQRKDEFLATLAHELRNPLAPILNAAKILARRETLSPNGQRAIDIIERQTNHMRRLVDDLLEVSRITRGKIELQPEPTLLASVISHAVETVLPAAESKAQRIETLLPLEPVRLFADPVRLAQIFENLLSNASRYTPRGGLIRIEAELITEHVEVRVIDNGIGIEPAKLRAVFELFVQAAPHDAERHGGLGIGLALVKRLVELHGGGVEAQSAGPGKGCTFVVRLPR